jgi:putative ABC transport system ATP-binding protein
VRCGCSADYYPDNLSGGQRQRVAVARALAADPHLVLADEPTAALDSKSGRDVVELLRTLARERGTAVLVVTHDHRILDIAHRIVRMEDGRLESQRLAPTPI